MTWPVGGREPLTRLLVRTKAVIAVVDDATRLPPALPPVMRLQRIIAGAAVELGSRARATIGGAVVFDALMAVGDTHEAEDYRLTVDADAALRPDRRAGYAFTVGGDPARWPVRVEVRLLPGPAYQYPPRTPVVRGSVLEAGPDRHPVADAVVIASADGGVTVAARCGADGRGDFGLGLPRYRPSRPTSIRASAPGGAVGDWRVVDTGDFERHVQLTVHR